MKGCYCQMVLMSVIPYNQGIFFVGMWVGFRTEKEAVHLHLTLYKSLERIYCQWNRAVSLCSPVSLCTFEIMHLDHPVITL
jgi:hypothetical protein